MIAKWLSPPPKKEVSFRSIVRENEIRTADKFIEEKKIKINTNIKLL